MKIRKNGKVIKLTESDLRRIVKKTMINEQNTNTLENLILSYIININVFSLCFCIVSFTII